MSLSFRINIILLLVMLIVGYGFGKTIAVIVRGVTNSNRCITMTNIVSRDIEDKVLRMENVLKASSLAARPQRLTALGSRTICDSICNMSDADSVYVVETRAGVKEIDDVIVKAWRDGVPQWSEPHLQQGNHRQHDPVVTLVVPLQDKRGVTYAMLCADMDMHWLRELAEGEVRTEQTTVKVSSRNGIILFDRNTSLIMTHEQAPEYSSTDAYFNGTDPHTETSHAIIGDSLAMVDKVIERTGWTLRCTIPMSDKSQMSMLIQAVAYFMLLVLFFIMALCIFIVIRWQLHPLRTIASATERMSKGDFTAELPVVKARTDIRELRDSFARMQEALKQYIQDLQKTTETKASMERDLAIASQIQQGMLPKEFPAFPDRTDIDIHGLLQPAKSVGGDLFDFFLKDEKLFFCIGDVSGKGVPAALFMTVVGHLFRNVGRHTSSPADICRSVNEGLVEGNEQNMFCTLFVGVLDMKTGLLDYCNAGHNMPIFMKKHGPLFMHVKVNMAAGAFDGADYTTEQIQMHPGDGLFLYTDGVTEAENKDKRLYGDDATLRAVASHASESMESLAASVLTSVRNFADGTEQSDDITILCLRYQPATQNGKMEQSVTNF